MADADDRCGRRTKRIEDVEGQRVPIEWAVVWGACTVATLIQEHAVEIGESAVHLVDDRNKRLLAEPCLMNEQCVGILR
jgi:hypothetical protein